MDSQVQLLFTEGAFEILTVPNDNTFTIQTPIAAVAGASSGTGELQLILIL